MRSMRSEEGLFTAYRAWALAALPVTVLLSTLPMLAIQPSAAMLSMAFLAWLGLTWVLQKINVWRGFPYLAALLITVLLGYLGLLLGLARDLGAAGLLVLGSWCSSRTESGLGEVWAMLRVAPLAHAGMFLGCSVGMWLTACRSPGTRRYRGSRWLYLLLCNTGMASGMVAMQLWQLPFPVTSPPSAALSMIGQMLLGMTAGMIAAWWLVDRMWSFCVTEFAAVGGVRE